MWNLKKLGPKGRQILENDELHIAGEYDIRYRGNRGPKPDLKDPTF